MTADERRLDRQRRLISLVDDGMTVTEAARVEGFEDAEARRIIDGRLGVDHTTDHRAQNAAKRSAWKD